MMKKLFFVITCAAMISTAILLPSYAETSTNICDNKSAYPPEVVASAGCDGNINYLPTIIQTILNTIIAICGVVAVIYVVIGGYGYMTSAGDAGKLEKAKKTIIYAVIGIAICALSFIIVNWVINVVKNA